MDEDDDNLNWWQRLLIGLALLCLSAGLFAIALYTDTTYYAKAGSPGWGVEGTRDYKTYILPVALGAFGFGTGFVVRSSNHRYYRRLIALAVFGLTLGWGCWAFWSDFKGWILFLFLIPIALWHPVSNFIQSPSDRWDWDLTWLGILRAAGRRRILVYVMVLYVMGLGWGYLRLPIAAIKSSPEFDGARVLGVKLTPRAITVAENTDVAPAQRMYIEHAIRKSNLSPGPFAERIISAQVHWNLLVASRVRSTVKTDDLRTDELTDCVYLCVFGAWVPVHTRFHGPSFDSRARHY